MDYLLPVVVGGKFRLLGLKIGLKPPLVVRRQETNPNLVQTFGSQVQQRPLDAGRKRLARLLGAEEQGDPEHPPSFRLRRLVLPGHFRDGPASDTTTMKSNNF